MGRKRTPKKRLAARAGAEASQDMSERGGKSSREVNERALHLLRAAEESEREGHIAGMAEAAAMVQGMGGDHLIEAHSTRDRLLAELRRRYGADNPRVIHHLQLRGLV